MSRPLLMIPGPIEISPAVLEAFSQPPPGHLEARVVEAFGSALERMRRVWLAGGSAQPFVVAGSGTTAMDMAAANLVGRGDRVVVVKTGYFSDRMEEMLRRLGATIDAIDAEPGDAPSPEAVAERLDAGPKAKALFATHVDTSTGVRVDPAPLAALARAREVLSVFDGVCATGAERFEMEAWGADVYLTASQKAIGLPPGLALLVASERALAAREGLAAAPPMSLDWLQWRPIMQAYEARRPSYFATPATNLVMALDTGLGEMLAGGIEERFAAHERAAERMRRAWDDLGLRPVPVRRELLAWTLSALWFPDGVDAALVGRILREGVIVAGGLHPAIRTRYFRVGHMGYAATRPEMLDRTVDAVRRGLAAKP
ncbi:MAG TPA: aminotransferase class V-fold PLP-dependent enzyme [Candidatus Polarisedimenticolaceae bacterium]